MWPLAFLGEKLNYDFNFKRTWQGICLRGGLFSISTSLDWKSAWPCKLSTMWQNIKGLRTNSSFYGSHSRKATECISLYPTYLHPMPSCVFCHFFHVSYICRCINIGLLDFQMAGNWKSLHSLLTAVKPRLISTLVP